MASCVLLYPTCSLAQSASSTDEMAVLEETPGKGGAGTSKVVSPSASLASAAGGGVPGQDEGSGASWLVIILGVGFLAVVVLTVAVMIYARRNTSGHTSHTLRGAEGPVGDRSRRPEALLIDKAGATELGEIAINEDVVIIGRSKQNSSAGVQGLVLPIGTVGRRHACIEYRSHAFYVSDLASVNGTFVNGNRVNEPTILHNGDIIRIESLELTFSLPMEGQGEETQFVPERGVDEAMAQLQETQAVHAAPQTADKPAAAPRPAKPASMIAQLSAEVEVPEAPEEETATFDSPPRMAAPDQAAITVAPGFEAAARDESATPPKDASKPDKSSVDVARADDPSDDGSVAGRPADAASPEQSTGDPARDDEPDITLTEPMEPEPSAASMARVTPPKSASDTHDSLIASLLADDEVDEDRTDGDAITGQVPLASTAPPQVAPSSTSQSGSAEKAPAAPRATPAPELPPPPELAPRSDAPTAMPMAPAAQSAPGVPDAGAAREADYADSDAPTSAFPDTRAAGEPEFPLHVESVDNTPPSLGDARAFAETTVGEADTQDPHAADTADTLPEAAEQTPAATPVDELLRKVEQSVPTPVLDAGTLEGRKPSPSDLEREGVVAPANLPPVSPRGPAEARESTAERAGEQPSTPATPRPAPATRRPAPAPPRRPASKPADMPRAFLVDLDGTTKTAQFQLRSDAVVIGRSKVTSENAATYMSIRRNTVGRKHATVRFARGVFFVEDHKSVNGTFVNGERVEGMSPLVSGDEIIFDTYRFSFVIMDDDEPDASLDPLDLDKTQFRGA